MLLKASARRNGPNTKTKNLDSSLGGGGGGGRDWRGLVVSKWGIISIVKKFISCDFTVPTCPLKSWCIFAPPYVVRFAKHFVCWNGRERLLKSSVYVSLNVCFRGVECRELAIERDGGGVWALRLQIQTLARGRVLRRDSMARKRDCNR